MSEPALNQFNRDDEPADPFDQSLRPGTMDEFTGQPKAKERLEVMIQSAKIRGEALDHILLSGPPGLGKTTLAHILAKAMGVQIRITSGPTLEKAGDLAGLLTSLEPNDVLFIDEIHRLNSTIEEYLYPAMEDFRIDIVIDQGPSARSVCLNLPRFTLVGATTRPGMLSAPLRSRFGIANRLEYYDADSLATIVRRSSKLLELTLADDAAREIACRSRGTPRIANNLLKWVRDFAIVKSDGKVTRDVADQALTMLEIDRHGLDEMDKRILETLILKFQGGPAGLGSLAVAVGEEAGTLEEVHEPYLIMEGYLARTQQGRIAQPLAYERLGLKLKPSQNQLL
ncbi:MAG: Holliday junction branch migration DNA helicase RuvB [Methylacidiphilales bacterium]|nr:Holliday junction branch migration DNA helicase RuvB [Candidatus Methylacidiphilales bacterium]